MLKNTITLLVAFTLLFILPTKAEKRFPQKNHRQGDLECVFNGSVHDGADVVAFFTISNKGAKPMICELAKDNLDELHVVGNNGIVFRHIDCYADSSCIFSDGKASPFDIKPGGKQLISVVIHDIPNNLRSLSDFDLPLYIRDDEDLLFHFDNIPVVSEHSAKKLK